MNEQLDDSHVGSEGRGRAVVVDPVAAGCTADAIGGVARRISFLLGLRVVVRGVATTGSGLVGRVNGTHSV